jgi:hypothetical protein
MSCSARRSTTPVFAALAARLDHAVVPDRAPGAPVIIVAGGSTVSPTTPTRVRTPRPAATRHPRQGQRARDNGTNIGGVDRRRGDVAHGSTHARVVLAADPYHCERIEVICTSDGPRYGDSTERTSPIRTADACKRMVAAAVRVVAGRRFGYARLDRFSEGHEAHCGTRYTLGPPRCRTDLRVRAGISGHPFGGGVIGNTTGSGPVIGGSIPPPRAGSTVTGTVVKSESWPRRLAA